MRDVLQELQSWYECQCDGEWEHQHGIHIDTLDNPGWTVEIDLTRTALARATLPENMDERSERDWIVCSAGEGAFRGAGVPRNLAEILARFLEWVGSAKHQSDMSVDP
jgi:hypothetical protein